MDEAIKAHQREVVFYEHGRTSSFTTTASS